ncbi:hypothetical protein ACFXPX_36835 [Kitasatospora sp. NPDC059146]|uniref:hypothetical protein n=1 Tax=unclassified Kitasatospora TaxID=2633591 RepID=UPI0036A67BC5
MGTNIARIEAEFSFAFTGGTQIVGMALEMIQKGAAERLSGISFGAILRGGLEGAEALRELRDFAGEMFGRVTRGRYDRRKFPARSALRSLLSAVEYAESGMGADALKAMQEAQRESRRALAR